MAEPITRIYSTIDQLKTLDGLQRFAMGAVRSVPQGIADVADKAVNTATLGLVRPGFGDAMRQTLQDSPVASQGTAADTAGELAPALLGINAAGRAIKGMVSPAVRTRYLTKDGVPFDVVQKPASYDRGFDYEAQLPRTNAKPFEPTVIGRTLMRDKGVGKNLPQASDNLEVNPNFRRQGVAGAMYDEAEKWRPIVPSTNLTRMGQKFWLDRDPDRVRQMLRTQFDNHVESARSGRLNEGYIHDFLDHQPDHYSDVPGVQAIAVQEADRARTTLAKEGLLPSIRTNFDEPTLARMQQAGLPPYYTPEQGWLPAVDHWTPALEAAQRRAALEGMVGLRSTGTFKPK